MKKQLCKSLTVLTLMLLVQFVFYPLTTLAAPRWNARNWMEHRYNSGLIRNKPLNEVAMPGSHDTLTYDLDKTTWDQVDNSFLQSQSIVQNVILNYSRTQEASLYTQLCEGIRYFDLRLKKDKYGHIRGYHGLFGSKVHNYLFSEVAKFLGNNPNEIIILDFQSLHNLSDADVQYLDIQMDTFLRGKLADRNTFSPSSTVKQFIESNARVIVLTDNSWWINKSVNVWKRSDSIISNWKNTSNIDSLINHLNSDLNNKPSDKFYVSQMVLSPNKDEIVDKIVDAAKKFAIPFYGPINFTKTLTDLAGNSLYKMNKDNNARLESWVTNAPSGKVNIAMRDFYTQGFVYNTITRN